MPALLAGGLLLLSGCGSLVQQGMAHLRNGEFKLAESKFKAAASLVEKQPHGETVLEYFRARQGMGLLRIKQGRLSDGLKELEAVCLYTALFKCQYSQEKSETLLELGREYGALAGKCEAARKSQEKLLEGLAAYGPYRLPLANVELAAALAKKKGKTVAILGHGMGRMILAEDFYAQKEAKGVKTVIKSIAKDGKGRAAAMITVEPRWHAFKKPGTFFNPKSLEKLPLYKGKGLYLQKYTVDNQRVMVIYIRRNNIILKFRMRCAKTAFPGYRKLFVNMLKTHRFQSDFHDKN